HGIGPDGPNLANGFTDPLAKPGEFRIVLGEIAFDIEQMQPDWLAALRLPALDDGGFKTGGPDPGPKVTARQPAARPPAQQGAVAAGCFGCDRCDGEGFQWGATHRLAGAEGKPGHHPGALGVVAQKARPPGLRIVGIGDW